jgi:hypothetical protein
VATLKRKLYRPYEAFRKHYSVRPAPLSGGGHLFTKSLYSASPLHKSHPMIFPQVKSGYKAALVQGFTETTRLAAGGLPCSLV